MPRTIEERQSKSTKDGKRLEDEMHSVLSDLLHRSGLTDTVELVRQFKVRCNPRKQNNGRRDDFGCVDLALVIKERPVVLIGCKKSFRERASQDAYLAVYAKGQWPDSLWVEMTRAEDEGNTGMDVLRAMCEKIFNRHGEFDAVASVLDGDALQRIKGLIKNHCLKELKATRDG